MLLLSLFALLAAGFVTWKLWDVFGRRLTELKDRDLIATVRQEEMELYLKRRDLWLARSNWLKTTQPPIGSPDQVDNELVNLAGSPTVADVTTEKRKLMEPVETEFYKQVGITFTAKGKLKDIFTWLHGLQKPEEFRAIRSLKVNPDQASPDKVVCEVQLLRWYAPK